MKNSIRNVAALLVVWFVRTADAQTESAPPEKKLPLPGEVFRVEGRTAFVILAALGVTALGQAVLLFVRVPSRSLFLASSVLGLGFAVILVRAGLESRGAVLSAGLIMVVVAVSVLAAVVSGFGVRTVR